MIGLLLSCKNDVRRGYVPLKAAALPVNRQSCYAEFVSYQDGLNYYLMLGLIRIFRIN